MNSLHMNQSSSVVMERETGMEREVSVWIGILLEVDNFGVQLDVFLSQVEQGADS